MTDQATETRTRSPNAQEDASSPAATRARAEMGSEILGARIARGEPGEKQPAHDDARLSASKTVEVLGDMAEQFEAETMKSSWDRAQETGNPHPVAPEDRLPTRGPAILAAAATAAGALGQARDAITLQLESDARLTSDPRYERDQKVFELGQTGKLGLVAPTEAEKAAQVERAGVSAEVAALVPSTPEEQVADDMRRLGEAEERGATGTTAAQVRETEVPAGEQDLAEKNNGTKAFNEGRTGDAAVAHAKSSSDEPTGTMPGNAPIK